MCPAPIRSIKISSIGELVEGLSQKLGRIQWYSAGSDFDPDPTTSGHWQCLEMSFVVTNGLGLLLASSEEKPGLSLSIYSAEHSPQQG